MPCHVPRSGKYYPATFSHAPLELRPVKMKKSMKSKNQSREAREQAKMYTWSPYTSNMFYSDPTGDLRTRWFCFTFYAV